MKKVNPDAKYYETNEWAIQNQEHFLLGITDFAQTVFGDINYIEFPKIGETFAQGQAYAVVESTKTATDISMPLSGKIIAINEQIITHPEILNKAPYQEGWLVKIEATSIAEWNELMTAEQYQQYIGVFFNKG